MIKEDRGPELRAVTILMFAFGTISMTMRIYTRAFMQRSWKTEDWMMVAAFCTYTADVITCLLGVHYGTGKHMADLTPYNIQKAMMYWWLCYPTFIATMILAKCSIGVFLNRISTNRTHHWIMYSAMFLTSLTGTAFFFVTIFQCSPIDYWWKQGSPAAHGSCIDVLALKGVSYTYSSAAILTDLIFAFLPIHIVMGLQMDSRTKMALVPIFLMGMLASVACIIRLVYIPKFTDADFLWATADIASWSEVEQGLAITAGNLATCRPLFRLTVEKINSWTGRTSRARSDATGGSGNSQGSSVRKLFTPNSLRKKLFRKRSYSREINVHTDVNVDVRSQETDIKEGYTDLRPAGQVNSYARKNSQAWLDSTVASKCDSSEESILGEKGNTGYNAV